MAMTFMGHLGHVHGPLGEPLHEVRHHAIKDLLDGLAEVEHLMGKIDLPREGS